MLLNYIMGTEGAIVFEAQIILGIKSLDISTSAALMSKIPFSICLANPKLYENAILHHWRT